MINALAAYKLSNSGVITSHFPARQFFVKDQASDEMHMHLRARVKSGDYFMTIATELERIAQNLERQGGAESMEVSELERIVSELLILTKDYTLIKK